MDSTSNDTSAAIEAGKAAVDAKTRLGEWQGLPYVVEGGKVHLAADLLEAQDARGANPKRRRGVCTLFEVASFNDFLKRHKQKDESMVFADPRGFQLEAVINGHPAGQDPGRAGWGDFRARYTCPKSPEWIFWTGADDKPMAQEAFADMIDARMEDLTSGKGYPEPVEVLEMARNLMVRVGGQYQRTLNPTTGEGTLVQKTEHGAESTKIPRAFKLALRVFDGGERYGVEARIRFKMADGRPVFTVNLHRRAELERDAFDGVCKAVTAATGLPLFIGSP